MPTRTQTVLVLLLICSMALGGCIGSFFGVTVPDDLREHGVAADAVILEIWDSGWTVNDDPVIGLRVRVTPSDGVPFEGTIKRYLISRLAVPGYQPGRRLRVRYDPADRTRLAVDDDSASANAVSADDMARIHDPAVVQLQAEYTTPPVPAALRGLRVLLLDRLLGLPPGADAAANERGCRAAGVLLFDRVGWYVVHDAAEPHDLVVHADCSAAVRFLTQADAVFVLLPQSAAGMRIDTPDGNGLAQLQALPRTLRCPADSDTERCAETVKDFAAERAIDQMAHSESLLRYAQGRGSARQ